MAKLDAGGWLHLQQSSKYLLAKKSIIQQLIAGLLLLVFTFSMAPRQFLHDAIANHKDKVNFASAGNETQVSNSGFFCKCDSLVAESPFTHDEQQFDFVLPRFFAAQPLPVLYYFHSSPVFFFELRGPPTGFNGITG